MVRVPFVSMIVVMCSFITLGGCQSSGRLPGNTDYPADLPISETGREEASAALIPYPESVVWHAGQLQLAGHTSVSNFPSDPISDFALGLFHEFSGVSSDVHSADASVSFSFSDSRREGEVPEWMEHPVFQDSSYSIQIENTGLRVEAGSSIGLLYAVRTLEQLYKTGADGTLPLCSIQDKPAFFWRGYMIDPARNFLPVETVKRQIEALSLLKMNILHIHITDHQAWRLESLIYPELNAAENHHPMRDPGSFYSIEQLKEIVDYAYERGVLVVPEIDMPGHSTAFENALDLNMQSGAGMDALRNILSEFFDLFSPTQMPIFHMGSDEVVIYNPSFVREMCDYIESFDRQVITWMPGAKPPASVITQLWTGAQKPVRKNDFIDSRATYLNHMDPHAGVYRMFMTQPCRGESPRNRGLGGEICLWNDNNVDEVEMNFLTAPVYPVMLAYAERIWRGAAVNREDLWATIVPDSPDAVEFALFEDDLQKIAGTFFGDVPFTYKPQSEIYWDLLGPIPNNGNFSNQYAPEERSAEEYVIDGKTYRWNRSVAGATVHLNHFWGYKSAMPVSYNATVYAKAVIQSDKEQEAGFWIQFGTPSASGRRNGGNPPAGKWNALDAMIRVNGVPVQPPVLQHPGAMTDRSFEKELALVDEGYAYREPTLIPLKKGVNEILLRVPTGNPAGYHSGKHKWMFTVTPVSGEGLRFIR